MVARGVDARLETVGQFVEERRLAALKEGHLGQDLAARKAVHLRAQIRRQVAAGRRRVSALDAKKVMHVYQTWGPRFSSLPENVGTVKGALS